METQKNEIRDLKIQREKLERTNNRIWFVVAFIVCVGIVAAGALLLPD